MERYIIVERYADNGELSHRALVDSTDGRELGTDGGEPEDQSFWRDWAWVPDELNKAQATVDLAKAEGAAEVRKVIQQRLIDVKLARSVARLSFAQDEYDAQISALESILKQCEEPFSSNNENGPDWQATVEALRAIIKQMGEQACVLAKDGMAAKAQVEALQLERDEAIEAASLPTWVCDGCGRVSSDGWINHVIESLDGTDYEMECPTCGVRDIEEDCALDLVRERDDLQAALDAEREKVAGLEAAASYYKQPSKNGGVYSVSGGHIGNLMDWCKDNLKHCKFSGPDEDNLDLDLVQTVQQIPQLKHELTQLQALVRQAENYIEVAPHRLHPGYSKDWVSGYLGALYDVGQFLSGKRTLDATTPATKGGDGE